MQKYKKMDKSYTIYYEEFASAQELPLSDRLLLEEAVAAAETAYSPYSHFSVGAAVRLADGTVVRGSNQENIAYPSGLCAERTAMFAASAQHPGKGFEALAIVARNAEGNLTPASPCGACRQVMSEYEQKSGKKLRIVLYWNQGKVLIFEGVDSLLPFLFTM